MEAAMKLYAIKTGPDHHSFCSILDEKENGYYIRISHDISGYEKIQDEFIARELFETCLRTGYLTETSAVHVDSSN